MRRKGARCIPGRGVISSSLAIFIIIYSSQKAGLALASWQNQVFRSFQKAERMGAGLTSEARFSKQQQPFRKGFSPGPHQSEFLDLLVMDDLTHSFMQMFKRNGENTEPCSTPPRAQYSLHFSSGLDLSLPININKDLPGTKEPKQNKLHRPTSNPATNPKGYHSQGEQGWMHYTEDRNKKFILPVILGTIIQNQRITSLSFNVIQLEALTHEQANQ